MTVSNISSGAGSVAVSALPGLAEDLGNFRNLHQNFVLHLQKLCRPRKRTRPAWSRAYKIAIPS
ncbi:MAG: hypothetical protein MZU84_07215 [Sphingobacterium sp.]|nr:hypothetical protein [Sphingobacterium sp.]